MSPGAVKVAIHRLRQRFRAAVEAEIAQTVQAETDLKAELHYLLQVLS
jgi:RNA polymerase sigma-70 factor (ECF subfamily)